MPNNDDQEKLNLRSEEVQEILSKPPAWIIRWGITLIFFFTFLILALTFIIRYPDFVSATVIITTEQPTERVVVKHTGAIDELFVRDRDTVVPGERLAVLRNTAVTRHVDYLKKLINTTTELPSENFYFPIDSTLNLVLGDIEAAYVDFEKNYVNYQLLKNLEPYVGQLTNNEKSISELKSRLEDQIFQKELQKQEFDLKKTDFERYQKLYQKGIISLQEFETKKIGFLEMQRNLSNMAISISQMREAISSAQQNLRSTVVREQEDQKRFATDLFLSLNNLKKSIKDWEHNYALKSSTHGVLSFQDFWGTNQHVNSGEVAFSILPLEKVNLMGKLVIPSHNAGKVSIGQRVLIKLNNFPYQQYGQVLGKIRNVSISPDKDGNYFIYISLPQGTKTSYNIDLPLKQELIGTAEIITEDLSVAERIFYSFRKLI